MVSAKQMENIFFFGHIFIAVKDVSVEHGKKNVCPFMDEQIISI